MRRTVRQPAEKPTFRRWSKPQELPSIMGDKSPKANQKKTTQKATKATTADKKKQQATAAKAASSGKKK